MYRAAWGADMPVFLRFWHVEEVMVEKHHPEVQERHSCDWDFSSHADGARPQRVIEPVLEVCADYLGCALPRTRQSS